MISSPRPVGDLIREWRQRRRMSQLDLALEASVSSRHLSFVETGRSLPSREMVLRLAEWLEVPLRERNALLAAAGYARTLRGTLPTRRCLRPVKPLSGCWKGTSRIPRS